MRSPGRVLVVAFEGWNDAGEAASSAVHTLKEQLDMVPILQVDPEDYFDYQFSRPTVVIDEAGGREIVWPSVVLYGPSDESSDDAIAAPASPEAVASRQGIGGTPAESIYLLVGTEPSRGWKSFTREVIEAARAHSIEKVVLLGALLADVPHTRPISVSVSSEDAELRAALGVERSQYEGPVGILSVLADAAERAGIRTLSIWASVPHYVHNAPSPKATLAIIDKLEEILDVVIPRGELVDEATAWEDGIDALAKDDEDMASYIEQLEQARDTVDSPEASGEAIAQEFEQYLRKRGDSGTAGDEPWRGPRE
jgi:hypothetical protein